MLKKSIETDMEAWTSIAGITDSEPMVKAQSRKPMGIEPIVSNQPFGV
jgi:hypothetical protein